MNGGSYATMAIQAVIVILGLVGLYYAYQYMFGTAGQSSTTLMGPKTSAQVDPAKPTVIPSSSLPPLYEGGEFSVSMFVYIQNWSYRMGRNKHILSIGGNNFDTIRIYLGANKPQLRVRLHTHTQGQVLTPPASQPTDRLDKSTQQAVFTALETDSELTSDASVLCDLPDIDMQKWVQVVVAVNAKTVDVYLDGKLARSCVLPTFYKVDAGGYAATLLSYGGFGGYVASVNMYSYAMSPDQVYHQYMAGPAPITDFGTYLTSFFAPSQQGPSVP
jgi:hypothetical protein